MKISKKASEKLKKLRLKKQFEEQEKIFFDDPSHPSLDFKPLRGRYKGFYSFRINDRYRARLVKPDKETYYVLTVGDFH